MITDIVLFAFICILADMVIKQEQEIKEIKDEACI